MKSKKVRGQVPPLCGEPGEDDGVAPETYFDPKRTKKDDRKVRQLCAQVARTLALTLGDVRVVGVEPAPDATVLRVTVTGEDPERLLARLRAAHGALRAAVA